MDIVSPEKRSRMMSGIRGKNTKPELVVRSMAHHLGLRFRLHVPNMPGRPDLVFPKHKVVIFVHGCFWHRHNCRLAAVPKTRPDFWSVKFAANQERDERNAKLLMASGWRVLIVWECETRDKEALKKRIEDWFSLPPA